MIVRSKELLEVAYYLSRFGLHTPPPENLNTNSWRLTHHMFFENLNEGRSIESFEHSLKNARDLFDSHFPKNVRKGWRDPKGGPSKLTGKSREIFQTFEDKTEKQIWDQIRKYCKLDVLDYEDEFDNISAMEASEKPQNYSKTEGGLNVFISNRIERNPGLRKYALKIHGHDCAVCGFNFERTYGTWGKGWAEVHHLVPVSDNKHLKRLTDPKTDLVVLCANCHRMVHRKKGTVLTIEDLKHRVQSSKILHS